MIAALNDFHFLRPEWLLALIPLAVLLFLLRRLTRRQSGWQQVLAGHLYQHLVTSQTGKGSKPPLYLLALGWLIATLALAGPTWERLPQPVYQLNTGKVLLMDMSMSMRATDIAPDRLARAKFKAIDLVKVIGEGETGLIAYAGDAFTISPLTSDAQNLTTLIPSLSPEIMPVPGSDPYLGLEAATELLKNAGYQKGEIFWITDGVDEQQLNELTEQIRDIPFRLSVLGIGTAEGAPIRLANGEFLKDRSGAIVLPKLQAGLLQTLANQGGGLYANIQADDSDIQYLTNQNLQDRDSKEDENQQEFGDKWKEMGPYLLVLLLPIAAYAFRRGVITAFLLASLLPLSPKSAHASWWEDMWQTADQRGMQSFAKEDFTGAAEKFNDPVWRGSSHYRDGNFEAALEAFSKSDATQSWYNKGNTLAQLGDIQAAIDAYDEVLAREPEHEDAKANKELLEQQQQNQQQQEQQDQQGDQQQQDQQQNQQGQNQQQQNDQQDSSSEQQQQQSSDSDQQQQQDENESSSEQSEQQESEQNQASQQEQQTEQQQNAEQEQQAAQQAQQSEELTDEEKEQMQRMQNLLRKIPDDPAFLLKRKMQLENEQRRRERRPQQRSW